MAYDEGFAERVREAVAGLGVEADERKMFGGLGFMVSGNMAVAVSGQEGLMVRVDPDDEAELLETTDAGPMEMKGRTMSGWLLVGEDHLLDDEVLEQWVERGVARAQALPLK